MFLSPGTKLDKYEIVAPLAVGGMAELYVARATGPQGFEKLCVVKRILTQHARDEEFVKMFLDEARLAATLRHPNVIQVYDVGSVKGRYYFAMEYVHGQDLASIVSTARVQRRGLRVGNALAIINGAAAGLHHAHEQLGPDGQPLHIVHRDVSPANILVSYEGHVKVVDFGIAKAAARATRTTAAGFKGKLCYMSPEQVQSRRDLDRRSDVFSLGVVLYELTTGKPLFRGEGDFAIAEKIVEGEFARPRDAREGYDPRLEDIVMTALAREPSARFPTALAMQLALEDYARSAQLVLSSHPLGEFMRELFSQRIEAWELAKQQGRSLAEFVRSTAELSALGVTDVGVTPAPPRRWWQRPGPILGGAALVAAIAGWGVVLARGSASAPARDLATAPRAVDPSAPAAAIDPPAAGAGLPAAPVGEQAGRAAVVEPVTTGPATGSSTAAPSAAAGRDKRHRPPKRDTRGTPPPEPTTGSAAVGSGSSRPRSLDETVNPFEAVRKPRTP